MKKGKLIVLYGINNLGKTTQAKELERRLNEDKENAIYLKYPLYDLSPSGIIINKYLRDKNPDNLSSREFQLMNILNRTQFQPQLEKILNKGLHVIGEDYTGTGLAWGIGAGVDEEFLKYANKHLLKEDLAFFFKGKRFEDSIEKGHTNEENEILTRKVAKIHEKLSKEYGWIEINANESIEVIAEELYFHTQELLKRR